MSRTAIRMALETRLSEFPALEATAWENINFNPETDTPYQEVSVLFARPENITVGKDGVFRQAGYMQVTLLYPPNVGAGPASRYADLLSEWFPKGLSVAAEGVTTTVSEPAEHAPGGTRGDRYTINVRIRFFANIN
jgi:hypothetical protein